MSITPTTEKPNPVGNASMVLGIASSALEIWDGFRE